VKIYPFVDLVDSPKMDDPRCIVSVRSFEADGEMGDRRLPADSKRIRQIQEQALQKMRVKIDKRNEPSAALAE
jgi:hypothetical protein